MEIGEGTARLLSKEGSARKNKNKIVALHEDGKLMPNILSLSTDTRRGIKHPARFPLGLPHWAITLCTDKGDLVCDPMCGSGTTLIQAKMMDRLYVGGDMSEEYAELANNLVDGAMVEQDMFNQEGGVKVEV